jgi:hypothetical protein
MRVITTVTTVIVATTATIIAAVITAAVVVATITAIIRISEAERDNRRIVGGPASRRI